MDQQGVTEHTGFPNPATDKTLASLDIATLLIKHPASTFFMRIDGHSWEQYGVFHTDIVIIDRALHARPSDVVTWWDETEFCISRYKHIKKQATVWGVISSVVHRYRP